MTKLFTHSGNRRSARGYLAGWLASRVENWRRLRSIHHDQEGTISILTVFSMMVLAMLLGMVMNVGRQVDRKVRMQNAADAAAYSGGVSIARGMNALAFTNHLLCDVFGLTSYLREARDRDAEKMVPDILSAWKNAGKTFSTSGFPKFDALGQAIIGTVPLEQEAVRTFSEVNAAFSQMVLPIMEQILAQEMIPKFQRSVVEFMPQVAQLATQQVALQHGQADSDSNTKLQAMLWRTDVQPVGTSDGFTASVDTRTLPVVDPVMDSVGGQYKSQATQQRKNLATRYLGQLNKSAFGTTFDDQGPNSRIPKSLSRFSYIWRGFTCGKLNQLLGEYPDTNLPFQIRTSGDQITDPTQHLDQKFTFVAVVYRPALSQSLPGLFKSPVQGDTLAFAQVRVFVPTRRLIKYPPPPNGGGGAGGGGNGGGASINGPSTGVPDTYFPVAGDEPSSSPAPVNPQAPSSPPNFEVIRQGDYFWVDRFYSDFPRSWDLVTQNWTAQLVPATNDSLAAILQANPPGLNGVQLPQLGGVTSQDLRRINTH